MRIMVGPVEVSGIASGLKEGFDQLGVPVEVVLSHPHPFAYGHQSRHPVVRIWTCLGNYHFYWAARLPRPVRLLMLAIWKAWSLIVLVWALLRFDAFIFLFSRTITDTQLEARLYAMLRKRVVMVYCGSDARPPFVDGPTRNSLGGNVGKMVRLARRTRAKIWLHERSGFVCVNSPFTAQFHKQDFVNWFEMGIPRVLSEQVESAEVVARATGAPIRVVHSPSNPAAKGTDIVLKLVETLRQEGYNLELVLLQGVPNEQVQAELKRCDFLIDQCWSDTPMASLVAEAAHHAKPAIVAGYAASEEYRAYLSARPPPTTYVHPDELETAVRTMVHDPELRRALGRRAFDFVREHWAPDQVARRYLKLLEGRDTAAYRFPAGLAHYVQGCGLPEEQGRETIRAILAAGGPGALHLDHNPALQQAFVEFAETSG